MMSYQVSNVVINVTTIIKITQFHGIQNYGCKIADLISAAVAELQTYFLLIDLDCQK